MKVYLDPLIETHIRKHIGDKIIHEVNVNVYGIHVLYIKKINVKGLTYKSLFE